MMIDNLELIKPLLTFEKEGDFYMLYIFLRKKDHKHEVDSNHQSVRTIKSYCISSVEDIDKRWDEITKLCELFGARAYIHVQSQNHATVGYLIIEEIAFRLRNGDTNFKHIFDSVVGQIKYKEKRWIVDIDSTKNSDVLDAVLAINHCEPYGNKLLVRIPTRNGTHLITTPFNTQEFKEKGYNHDIQKKNPTLLYYPNSLP